jgi:hypothetical protein
MLELGMRYARKKNGTILICDRSKTDKLPFDLSDYRTIFFDDTRDGGAELVRAIEDYSSQIFNLEAKDGDSNLGDSPFFNHYDAALEALTEAELRREIASLKRRLSEDRAEQLEEPAPLKGKYVLPPSEMLSKAKAEIEGGNLPWELLARAQSAVSGRHISEFLDCIEKITALRAITLSDREYRDLYYLAGRLDLRNVLPTIIEIGLSIYPDSDLLQRTKMDYLAHSVHQHERQEAKDLISQKLKIDLSKGNIDVDRITNASSQLALLSIFLDAVHRDSEDELALKIVEKLHNSFPKSSVVVRNYARAIQRLKGTHASLDYYLKSVRECPDVDDTSARWLAAELWESRRVRDVIEVSTVACMIDLDDAGNYAALAFYMSELLQPRNIFNPGRAESIETYLSSDDLIKLIVYGRSCPMVSLEDRATFETAMQNANVTSDAVQDYIDNLGIVSRQERAEFVRGLYARFSSNLTSLNGDGESPSAKDK